MGIEPSAQTVLLRRLLAMSQLVSSHVVHLYALVLPDFEGYPGLPSMLEKYPAVVERLLRMRTALKDLTKLVGGGRGVHPIGTVVGGFTRIPSKEEFRASRDALIAIREDAVETFKMVADFDVLDFSSEREFVTIRNEESYAIEMGEIISNKGLKISEDDYYDHFSEFQMPYAMTKQTRLNRTQPIMVGSLARVNLKYDQIFPQARELAEQAGFKVPDYNPFHNNLAQAIEIVHGLEECIQMIESLDPKPEKPHVDVRAGEAGAVTEAPRGFDYHSYAVNRRGVIEKANIITPTAHNFMMIEHDFRGMATQISDRPVDEIRRWCEVLVRAYDPCFSCSVH
jgi:sulfhydrogenase subunit alpha